MKQVLQSPSGTFVRDVPRPPCPPGNVLVRNRCSIISSGTERARVDQQKSVVARVTEQPQLALKVLKKARTEGISKTRELIRQNLTDEGPSGYSSAGVVIEVGSAVRGLSVGDLVACAGAGHANHAEIVSIPRNLCAKVPDGVPLEAAALTTIAAIALHGVRLAEVRLGDRVAVVGCGLVGQIASRLLVASGATVFVLDVDAGRVEAGIAAGAAYGIPADDRAPERVGELTDGLGVDAVVVTAASSSNSPLLLAAAIARDRGSVVLVGDVRVDIPREPFFEKELSFRISRSYGPGRYDRDYEERGLDYPIGYVRWTEQRNMECVLDLQARGALTLHDLVDGVMTIDQAEEAYARLAGPPEERPRGALAFSYGEGDQDGDTARREPTPAAPPLAAEDGPLRVGLIGPGAFATSVLVPAIVRSGASLAAVAGGSGPSAEAAARTAGFARAADTEQDLIADPGVDAVIVATRHGTHAALVRSCLESEKHVFCEKPLALDHNELESVMAAARTARRVLAVGFNRRFSPHAVAARTFIADSGGPIALSYRVSAGRIPPSHWVHDLEQGGGRLIGECCHFLDTLSFLAGSKITEVHAVGFGGPQQPLQTRDNLVITLTFESGSVGTLVYVADGSPGLPKERLEVFAGDRTVVVDDYRVLERYDGPTHSRDRLKAQDKGHAAEVAAFVHGVRAGEHPISLDAIENVHLACFAAVDSLRTGLRTHVA